MSHAHRWTKYRYPLAFHGPDVHAVLVARECRCGALRLKVVEP